MASSDLSELVLVKRLTSHSEALDRNISAMQQAFEKVQESFANLRRVWGGDAAEEFYEHWMRTADRLEQTFDKGRRLKALLDERLDSLRMADRPFDETAAAAGALPSQMRIPFPLSPEDQEGLSRLEALRRQDAIPLLGEEGGQDFTRAILEIAGTSVQGRSEGPKQIPKRLPGTTFQAMRHAGANAIMEAKLKGLTGSHATLYVDQPVCGWCRPALGPLARWLGVDKLRVVDATGDLGEF